MPPEEKKPGTTRNSWIVIGSAVVIIGTPIIIYAVKSPAADLKDLAMLGAGAIVGALGATVAFYFGKA
jgi:hypothetical protein